METENLFGLDRKSIYENSWRLFSSYSSNQLNVIQYFSFYWKSEEDTEYVKIGSCKFTYRLQNIYWYRGKKLLSLDGKQQVFDICTRWLDVRYSNRIYLLIITIVILMVRVSLYFSLRVCARGTETDDRILATLG